LDGLGAACSLPQEDQATPRCAPEKHGDITRIAEIHTP
jgi:hypothetical protein